jgi:uncharacterized membrane protein YbhN (UPF0104 family)
MPEAALLRVGTSWVKSNAKVSISLTLLVAALVLIASNYDLSAIISDLRRLSIGTLATVALAFLANALIAVLRFKVIAADMGHQVSFRNSMAAVSAGTLAGALFFQLAGQLIARGAIMGRGGVPFASVVVITLYERVVAAIISALVAIAGAYLVFGRIYIDPHAGGAELIKLMIGLIAATLLAAMIGYGRIAIETVSPLISQHFAKSMLRVVLLTVFVQLPIMVAYVATAHAFSPKVSILDLSAAAAIVMFAASVPISLAGWGVREMSAVAALGLIGVSAHAAFATAIIVGLGSLISMGVVAAASLPLSKGRTESTSSGSPIDYTRALGWALPLAAATLVPFQVYVPVGSGILNVNLADPIALIAAALFILVGIKDGHMPRWRTRTLNRAIGLTTVALTIALAIGWSTFGLTTWAWLNRYLGWFVLLAYGATGALIVRQDNDALRILLLTYVGAIIAVTGLDLIMTGLRIVGLDLKGPIDIEGFSQNHNFFAFQLLMATCAILVLLKGKYLRPVLLSLVLVAFWFTGSRSGWIATLCVLGLGLYLRTVAVRELLVAVGITVLAASPPFFSHVMTYKTVPRPEVQTGVAPITTSPVLVPSVERRIAPEIIPSEESTQERILTLREGWKLFKSHPLFGAGLGAFRNEMFMSSTTGIPLLIHSTALWLLAELGVFGFLMFAIPAISVFRLEWKRRQEDTAKIIILSFVAFAVMSGPADMLYQRTFWMVIGAALARPVFVRPGQSQPTCANDSQ